MEKCIEIQEFVFVVATEKVGGVRLSKQLFSLFNQTHRHFHFRVQLLRNGFTEDFHRGLFVKAKIVNKKIIFYFFFVYEVINPVEHAVNCINAKRLCVNLPRALLDLLPHKQRKNKR